MYKVGSSDTATAAQVTSGIGPQATNRVSNWYAKVAQAWGAALDRQADKTVALAQHMNEGQDAPGAALQVSAAAHQLAFLSTAASTASNTIGQALETLGRKQ
jgi:hypothetical protein